MSKKSEIPQFSLPLWGVGRDFPFNKDYSYLSGSFRHSPAKSVNNQRWNGKKEHGITLAIKRSTHIKLVNISSFTESGYSNQQPQWLQCNIN